MQDAMQDEEYGPRLAPAIGERRGPAGETILAPSPSDDARASRDALWLLLGVVVYCGAQVYLLI
jgi:hypothetical protein